VPRISVFRGVADDDAFERAWRETRAPLGARLYRAHASSAEFPWAEIAPGDPPRPDLPAATVSAVYEAVIDDLPPDATGEVVWINVYELPPEEDESFVAGWTRVRDIVAVRPGYVGSRLHRAIDPGATFRWVNVAPWSDLEEFTAAVATPAFAEAATAIYHQAHPGLFVPVA
jgi:heme-degrading monooxygenase HmoA